MGKMVRCIDNSDAGLGYLVVGQTYEVQAEVIDQFSKIPQYAIKGVRGDWNVSRFVDADLTAPTVVATTTEPTAPVSTPVALPAPEFDFDTYNRTVPGGQRSFSMDRAITRHTK
jgi:hypothetical protein